MVIIGDSKSLLVLTRDKRKYLVGYIIMYKIYKLEKQGQMLSMKTLAKV